MEKYMTPIVVSGLCGLMFAAGIFSAMMLSRRQHIGTIPACDCDSTARTAKEQQVLTDNSLQLEEWPTRTDLTVAAPVRSRAPLAERAATWTARKAQP